jgi:DNA mismatch repair ATPase MutS
MAVFLNGIADLGELLRSSESSTLRHRGNTLLGLLSTLDIQTLGVLCGRRSPIVQMRFDRLARLTAKGTLQELVALVASVEAMWSMAFAAADLQWSYPEPSDRFRVEGLCHPLLRDQGAHNNLDLDPRTRVCIITGPNMAGKSTFIKAVGIALLLAHAGCGVPARSMEFQPMAGIFAAIQVADDLRRGESLYLAELRRVKSLAMLLQQQSAIAILDELFRGTNILDANDATVAVLSRLVEHPSALIFVASHLTDTVSLLSADSRVRVFCFTANNVEDQPVFDYRLREGVSRQRLGMSLLRREGVLELLDQATKA